MERRRLSKTVITMSFAVALVMFSLGYAMAWEVDQSYATGTQGQPGAQAWSPFNGRLAGDVGTDAAGFRATQPYAYNVVWNRAALDWAKTNSGVLSITFHSSFDGNTGPFGTCDNEWLVRSWLATNLPASQGTTYNRSCNYTYPSEIRIFGDKMNMVPNQTYWAQSYYRDQSSTLRRKGQFNVDTYWNGSENYHQKYCVDQNSFTAKVCS